MDGFQLMDAARLLMLSLWESEESKSSLLESTDLVKKLLRSFTIAAKVDQQSIVCLNA